MKLKFSLLFFVVLISCRAETLTVEALRQNEEIKILYSSSGCFHFYKRLYALSGGSERVFAVSTVDEPNVEGAENRGGHAVKYVGQTTVSTKEVTGLDRLFGYYRSGPSGGCTTFDTIEVGYYRDGVLIGSEKFDDGSCGFGRPENVVTFSRLEQRIGKTDT